MTTLELTAEQANYLRILVASDVADRTRELRLLSDPHRFQTMRDEAVTAIRTGSEIIGKLPARKSAPISPGELIDMPVLLRRQAE